LLFYFYSIIQKSKYGPDTRNSFISIQLVLVPIRSHNSRLNWNKP